MREHHEIDEEVRKGPASWTLLKPHLYMQNLLRAANAVRREGRLAAPMGGNRFPLVDTRDVGAAAAMVLRRPAAHAGKEYALTGPVAVSYEEVAKALTAITDRAVTHEAVAPPEFEDRLRAAGMPEWRAYDLATSRKLAGASGNIGSPTLRRSPSAGSPDRYPSSLKTTGMPIPPDRLGSECLHMSALVCNLELILRSLYPPAFRRCISATSTEKNNESFCVAGTDPSPSSSAPTLPSGP